MSHFVALQVPKVKTCRMGFCGFSLPLVALHLVRGVGKGLETEISGWSTYSQAVENFWQLDNFCWNFIFRLNFFCIHEQNFYCPFIPRPNI